MLAPMRRFTLLYSFCLCCLCSAAQTDFPDDYPDPATRKGHLSSVYAFLDLLEKGDAGNALLKIDSSFSRSKGNYKDSLEAYAIELKKYLATTSLSVVTVFPEKGYYTYRCRYYNGKGDFFYMDLYLHAGQPGSLIAKIIKVSESVLISERKELAERIKNEKRTGPPPPPPFPPPDSIMRPLRNK
ncbi:MAG: hypothetical protein ABW019_09465 [Chitinophagaceae bacterium]